ncbi:MAG: acyltransferase family protein [Akkermansia sp.]|nr:acyltransferase family protein [Akkermansia sp.]
MSALVYPPHATLQGHQREHKSYIDLLRLFAITLVVFNHTPAYGFPLSHIFSWNVGIQMMFISLCTKVAVPLFFMIAGGLLLGRQESVCTVLKKRVVRFVLLIAFFSAVQYAWVIYQQKVEMDVATYITSLWHPGKVLMRVEGMPVCGSLLECTRGWAVWFLYAYLGLLLMLPLLRGMVQSMQKAHFVYFVGLLAVVGILLPAGFYIAFGYAPPMRLRDYMPLINRVLFPFIMGYYIEHHVDVLALSWRKIACWCGGLFFLALCVVLLSCHLRLHSPTLTQGDIEGSSWYVSCYLLLAVATYVLFKKFFTPIIKDGYMRTMLAYLGNAVLTVMIFENIFRAIFMEYFERYYTSYLSSVYVAVLSVCSGLILGLILKKIPFLKKIL